MAVPPIEPCRNLAMLGQNFAKNSFNVAGDSFSTTGPITRLRMKTEPRKFIAKITCRIASAPESRATGG